MAGSVGCRVKSSRAGGQALGKPLGRRQGRPDGEAPTPALVSDRSGSEQKRLTGKSNRRQGKTPRSRAPAGGSVPASMLSARRSRPRCSMLDADGSGVRGVNHDRRRSSHCRQKGPNRPPERALASRSSSSMDCGRRRRTLRIATQRPTSAPSTLGAPSGKDAFGAHIVGLVIRAKRL
jgi:hypothetical protein